MKHVFHLMVVALGLLSYNVFAATEEATQLNDQARHYYQQGNYSQALKALQASLLIKEKVLGKQHPSTATSYNNIGGTYYFMGDYPKALEYQQKSFTIREKVLGKQHLDIASSYNHIGVTYRAMGDYPKALEYHQKSLIIQEKSLGKQHPSTAGSYSNIGGTYQSMDDYPKALEYFQKALTIREKVLGKQHSDTASSYNNIGSTYQSIGNYSKALEYQQKALTILKKVLGKQHPFTAISYHSIGQTYQSMDDYPKALEYQQKAIALQEEYLGKQHPDTASSYNAIGLTYQSVGDYTKALEYCQKSLAIQEKVLGKQHPNTADSYDTISVIYNAMGDYSKAYQYSKKAFAIFLQQRNNNFVVLDAAQKKHYLTSNARWIDHLFVHADHYQQMLLNHKDNQQATQVAQETLNDWLAYKGSILESENRLISLAKTSKDSVIQKKYQQLAQLKRTYSQFYKNSPQPEQVDTWQQKLKQQEIQIATLQREIIQGDSRFKSEQDLKKMSSKTIANALSEKELYIDYAKTNEGYYFFTIDHNNTISFTAFNEKQSKAIEKQLALFADDIENITESDEAPENLQNPSKASLSQLHQLLIPTTLASKITTKDSLIISPDGALRLLPFEALYNQAKKQYLIEQKDIRYIASGKELARLSRQQSTLTVASNNKIVLFANPDFDKDSKKTKKPTVIYNHNTIRASFSANSFNPLPATKIEAEAIINILKKDHNIHYYQASEATEANLLAVKQPKLLHIATSGLFDADISSNPMLQSFLVLAGANKGLENRTGEGIVTALDLAGLDLKGTELVVLSACDTGKLDLRNTEGVSGLTKAFTQAGAKRVLVSLWSVVEQEAAQLMMTFYQALENNNQHYARALKQSKLAMIKEGLHPYYWAGFVLHGL